MIESSRVLDGEGGELRERGRARDGEVRGRKKRRLVGEAVPTRSSPSSHYLRQGRPFFASMPCSTVQNSQHSAEYEHTSTRRTFGNRHLDLCLGSCVLFCGEQ